MADLRGKTAVVTGGGRGLGRAFAQALDAAGADVVVVARSADELKDTAALLGPQACSFPCDIADAGAVAEIFAKIGPVDVLVNNAGVMGPIGPLWEVDFERWWAAMEVNVRGAMLCTRAVVPGMIARRSGRIINLATGAIPAAYLSAYMSSKTALVRATECLAAELEPHGVFVFSVAPGTVRTKMTAHSLGSEEGRKWIPWFRRIFEEHLDLPPEKPAELIVELAAGRADALTGLYLTPFDDLDQLVHHAEQVKAEKLHSLRVRTHASSRAPAALAAIRDAGNRAKES